MLHRDIEDVKTYLKQTSGYKKYIFSEKYTGRECSRLDTIKENFGVLKVQAIETMQSKHKKHLKMNSVSMLSGIASSSLAYHWTRIIKNFQRVYM